MSALHWRHVREPKHVESKDGFREQAVDSLTGCWNIQHVASSTRGAWCLYHGVDFVGDFDSVEAARAAAQLRSDASRAVAFGVTR